MDNTLIEKIMRDYYDNIRVEDIIEKYGLTIKKSQILSLFPLLESDELCPYCSKPLVAKRPSRSASKNHINIYYCKSCGHRNDDFCNCNGCQAKRQEAINKSKELIKSTFSKQPQINLQDLSFEDLINLGALCHGKLSPESTVLLPIGENTMLTPDSAWDRKLIDSLLDKGAISVSGMSNVSAFDTNDFPNSFYIKRVCFDVNLAPNDIKLIIDGELPDLSIGSNLLSIKNLLRLINKYLILRYLLTSLREVNLSFSPGAKTDTLINTMLDHFSLAQSLYAIKKCVGEGLLDYKEENIYRKHAANRIIAHLINYTNSAIENNYKPCCLRYRPNNLKESLLEQYLIYNLLNINNSFTQPLNELLS